MSKPKLTQKRKGFGLEARIFTGKSGQTYMVFKAYNGNFHVFAEVEARKSGTSRTDQR